MRFEFKGVRRAFMKLKRKKKTDSSVTLFHVVDEEGKNIQNKFNVII